MKAIILARVSTEEQKEAGNSIPAQLQRLRDYVNRNPKLEAFKEFDFDESAYKQERDEFQKILQFVRSSKEPLAICCDKVDRLIRNFTKDLIDLEELRMKGRIELHFPSDNLVLHKTSPATDNFHYMISVGLARYFSDANRDNTKRALEQKRRNGDWCGPPPFGYGTEAEFDGIHKTFIPDPERGPIAIEIFERYASGKWSIGTLTEDLKRRGITARNKGPLARSLVAHILRNPFYYGIAFSKRHDLHYEHRYATLISKELFDKVQMLMASKNRNPVHVRKTKTFAFSDILTCATCGCSVCVETKKEGKYVLYACTNAKHAHKRLYVNEKKILAQVAPIFEGIQLTNEQIDQITAFLKAHYEYQSKYHKGRVAELQRHYNELQAKLKRAHTLRIDLSITQEVYDATLLEVKDQQATINDELSELTITDHKYHLTANSVLRLAKRAGELFKRSSPAEKRELLKMVLSNPQLNGKKLEYSIRSPFQAILNVSSSPIGLRG